MGFYNCSMFSYALLCVYSNFAITLMGKRALVALLCLSFWCLVIVVWLFLTIPRVCLQYVVVVSPDHTHLIFSKPSEQQRLHVLISKFSGLRLVGQTLF